jgi:hypothetical protein
MSTGSLAKARLEVIDGEAEEGGGDLVAASCGEDNAVELHHLDGRGPYLLLVSGLVSLRALFVESSEAQAAVG